MRHTGTVKWFNSKEGFKTLEEGQRVEFDIVKEDKGEKAQNVVVSG